MSKLMMKPLVLAIALAGLGPLMISAPLSASVVQEKVTLAPGKSISPQEEAVVSSAGVKVLRHIAQARSDIHNKDAEGAKNELGQAEKLLNIIKEALPTTKVKDHIWVAKKHLEYENTEEVLPDLIPIHTSLDELVDIMPVDAAKKHLEKAKEHLKSGDKEKAKQSLEATDAALQYTEVDLPMSVTRQFVAQAKADLNKEKLEDADKALKSAEDGVVYLSVAIEQPLFIAKALLWQTVLDLEANDQGMAKADLQGAIGYLEIAAKSDQKSTHEVAEELLKQAKALQQDLQGGKDIGARLRHLWQRAEALADRSVEYLAAGWARYRTDSPLKSDLIEAKLHLTNARIDLFTGHESAGAKKELEAAGQFLDKAIALAKQKNSGEDVQNKITELRKGVEQLSAKPESAKESRYTLLQQELRGIIRSL